MIRFRTVALAFLSLATTLAANSTQAQTLAPSSFQELRWRMVGPFRGGRTRAVAGVPGKPDLFYIGHVNGGVWRSDDAGRSWVPIFDDQPTQSIGALAVAPSNPSIIYAGTGEGLHRPDLAIGNGVYKSTDGGKSWKHMGLDDAQQISALAIDPRDPNRIFAAVVGHPYGPSTQRGIFRSLDGGSTWTRVLYKDENTGANDLELDASNPNVLYASLWESRLGPTEDKNKFEGNGGGLFKSTDGGDHWTQLKNGLPDDLVQIDVAVAPSNPRRLYGIGQTTKPTGYMTGAGMGFYRSDDGGENWVRITEDPRPMMLIGGGDLPVVKVDPNNADVVYSASIVTVRSKDGGRTWESLRGAPGGDDYQNLWINPNDSNVILLASDQGAVATVNGGKTWSSWYNQPTAQLYHVGVTAGFPYQVCSGQQESGSVCISSRGDSGQITFRDWRPVGTIEYGYVTPDPIDPDVIYGGGRDEVTRFRFSTGQTENISPIPLRGNYRVNRTEPLIFSPADPHTMFYAANMLFKTNDGGKSWQKISSDLTREHPGTPPSVGSMGAKNPKADQARGVIYSVAPAVHDIATIWAGTDDGLLWRTTDGGAHWSDITPAAMSAWSKVTQISASAFDNDTAYASVSRFRVDDLHPYIFRTHDGGKSWQTIVTGLPDAPVNAVREDPVRKGLLFAATENGVWMSLDDGDHWQSLQLNLPRSSARDIVIHKNDLIVATHGRSFWILDDISPLRQLTPDTATGVTLFKPADAVRIRRSLNTDTPLPADEPSAENPPDGAIIDYRLGSDASTVALEIVDGAGKVVRRYSSSDKPWITAEELQKQTIPPYWVKMPQTLSTRAGMHRWVWDLHYTTPVTLERGYPIAAVPHATPQTPQGPLALPASYTVRLIVDGKATTAPLNVTLDPRVKTPAAGIAKMFELETQLAEMLSRSSQAVLAAKSYTSQLEKLASARGVLKDAGDTLRDELATLLDGPKDEVSAKAAENRPAKTTEAASQAPKPAEEKPAALSAVQGEIATLYESIDRADVEPTPAQVAAIDAARTKYASVMSRWNAIESGSLMRLNRELKRKSLPVLRADAEGLPADSGAHEE